MQSNNSTAHFVRCTSSMNGTAAATLSGSCSTTTGARTGRAHKSFLASLRHHSGGGSYVGGNFSQADKSTVRFENCRSKKRWGGMTALVSGAFRD